MLQDKMLLNNYRNHSYLMIILLSRILFKYTSYYNHLCLTKVLTYNNVHNF